MLTILLVSILGMFGFGLMLTPLYRINKSFAIFLFVILFTLWLGALFFMNAEGVTTEATPQPFWAK